MKIKRFIRRVKAVSPVLSVLMIIIIAVAASLVTYAWVMGYLAFSMAKAGKSIQIQSTAFVGDDLNVYVQNVGDDTIELDENGCIYINDLLVKGPDIGSDPPPVGGKIILQKGATATFTVFDQSGLAGKTLKVKVVALGGTFMESTSVPTSLTPPDSTPPTISNVQVTPSSGSVGTIFTISADAVDSSGVSSVVAHIQNPDETDVDTVNLLDPELDGTFTGTYDSIAVGNYFVDIFAVDNLANNGESENADTFTVTSIGTSLTCGASPSIIILGEGVTTSGTLTPALNGITIELTYTRPDMSTVIRTTPTNPSGAYTDTYSPDTAGTWTVSAYWAGDATHDPATSTPTTFQVKPANWYDANWGFRKSVTIQEEQIPSANSHSIDATGGYMNIGGVNWGSQKGTISFWIKWDTVSNRPWGQHDNMELRITSGPRLAVDWGYSDALQSVQSFIQGKWYFVAVVWDEVDNELKLYIGDETSAPSLDNQNLGWTSAVSGVGVTQNNFMASRTINPTDGHGDDLRYWNIDRTLAELQSDYKKELTGSETNLRSYYRLNNNFDDVGPNNNDASGSGSYSFSTDVPNLSTSLTDFPVLISISDTDLRDDAQDDGDDILFTSSDGKTKLKHELEKFDGATGQLVAWVKVPTLSTSTDTVLYMYYGNLGASSQQDPANVWDTNYRGVWHLKETAGGADAIRDSKGANHGTDRNNPTLGASGKIGNCIDLDGSNDYIEIVNESPFDLTSAITVSAWIKVDTFTRDWQAIVTKGDSAWRLHRYTTTNYVALHLTGATDANGDVNVNNGQWHYVVGTLGGGQVTLYVDGAINAQASTSGAISTNNYKVYFGENAQATNRYFDGKMDEIRISNVARSPAWVQTEYNNQNSPSSFYGVGPEET